MRNKPRPITCLNAARFLIEVQRHAGQATDLRDPLAVAKAFIRACPSSKQAQVLRRLVRALISGNGLFSRNDVTLLSLEGAKLAATLIDAQLSALYTEQEWRAAAFSVVPPVA